LIGQNPVPQRGGAAWDPREFSMRLKSDMALVEFVSKDGDLAFPGCEQEV
jgi:hypothetical protein